MMNVKKFFVNFSLIVTLLAVMLTAGGCGGGGDGGGENPKPRVLLSSVTWDSDGNGLPDVFDARASRTFAGFLNPSELIEVPDEDEIKKVWSHDIACHAVDLRAGVGYSAVFYDIYGGRALDFTPHVDVSPQGGSPLSLDVNLSCAENLGAIILNFTPLRSGQHIISIRNVENINERFDYIFDLIEDKERNGLAFDFVGGDNKGREFRYSPEDIMFLKARLLSCVLESDDRSFPTKINVASADIAWKEAIDFVNRVHFSSWISDGNRVKLPGLVSGVRRTSNLTLGTTLNALSGYFAQKMEAPVEDFTLPSGDLPVKINTSVKYISNQNEHAGEFDIIGSGNKDIAASRMVFDLSNEEYKEGIKYGEFSTTMLLKWEMLEDSTRLLPMSQYKLTQHALDFLAANGSEKFRDKWGDYFVAGERRGASYLAMVTIAAASSSKIEDIKQYINPSLYLSDRTEFQRRLTAFSATPGWHVNISVKTHGGNASDSPSVQPNQLIANLDKFIEAAKHPNFIRAPLSVELVRFNQLVGGEKIDEFVEIPPDLFPLNQKMACAYIGALAASDTLLTIPTTELRDPSGGDITDIRQRLKALITAYDNQLRDISLDAGKVATWTKRLDDARDESRVFLERYGFYRKIMYLRSMWRNSRELGNSAAGDSIGYSSYSVSAAVNNDLNQGLSYSKEYHEGWGFAVRRYWYPEWDVAPHHVISYIKIRSESNKDQNWDNNAPSIGNTKLKWSFKGGETRDANWFLTAYTLPLGNDFKKYPFNWDVY